MTPKEKAKELVEKMEKDFQYFASREIAKQCALIAQEKTIEALKKARTYTDYGTSAWADIDNDIIFEIEVRIEIEKL
jgi:hypothetical protein